MNAKILKVRWAGLAVAGAVLSGALGATPRLATATPAAPVAAVTAVHVEIACAREALAYILAWKRYLDAWNHYDLALPGGTYDEIMDAALLLDEAAVAVGTAGMRLIACLGGLLGGAAGGGGAF